MDNYFEGGIAELEEAKIAISEDIRKGLDLDQAKDNLKLKEKEIEEENREIENKIQEVLKAKKNAISEPLNEEIDKANAALKDSIRRRTAAKEVAVNNRINKETSGFSEQNIEMETSAKSILRGSGMPTICRKPFFYSIYAPVCFRDYLTIIITALITLVVIPLACVLLINTTTVGKVFIYVCIVAFFVLIYLAIYFWTQPKKNRKVLETARPYVEQMRANKKQVKKVTKSIRSDKDESTYGLEALDGEIARNRGIYDNAVAKKEEQLKIFEENIRTEVRKEVTDARADVMNRLLQEKEFLSKEFDQKQYERSLSEQKLQQNYGSYLGKKNMDPERIDQLIAIIESGKASNILEALDVQKEENKITNRISGVAEKIKPDDQFRKDSQPNKTDGTKDISVAMADPSAAVEYDIIEEPEKKGE